MQARIERKGMEGTARVHAVKGTQLGFTQPVALAPPLAKRMDRPRAWNWVRAPAPATVTRWSRCLRIRPPPCRQTTLVACFCCRDTQVGDVMVLVALRRSFYDPTMIEAIAFDTHRFVKRLTESGFTERQAETLAEEHVVLLNANLATKADIAEIKAGTEALRQETKAAIEAVKTDLLKWLFGALVAQGGLIVALVKLL